jgi:hypothetical protein
VNAKRNCGAEKEAWELSDLRQRLAIQVTKLFLVRDERREELESYKGIDRTYPPRSKADIGQTAKHRCPHLPPKAEKALSVKQIDSWSQCFKSTGNVKTDKSTLFLSPFAQSPS